MIKGFVRRCILVNIFEFVSDVQHLSFAINVFDRHASASIGWGKIFGCNLHLVRRLCLRLRGIGMIHGTEKSQHRIVLVISMRDAVLRIADAPEDFHDQVDGIILGKFGRPPSKCWC